MLVQSRFIDPAKPWMPPKLENRNRQIANGRDVFLYSRRRWMKGPRRFVAADQVIE
jgi:hypothetical protein